ncbi:hypothetical protein NCS57_00964800 [Fusarium keratoplasticum]|uniref:Uncharacterized protein n=1 Tax=Fusarium keratoplasticum TaxID=1328300 RepID=A0ACC0QQJ5_9HYPO|nr:hypothetical protein NCS57_00964800 [Fusarium keratoplasticum]KAI8663633.1 hypothetical protein NCS57_00964800 [Fusarium keratoplasticum]KAI8664277.1 hypothetical protein NCS55_00935900 [Fusarium keratoplasticum]
MEDLGNIREHIARMELANANRRRAEREIAAYPPQPGLASQDDDDLPALPPRLPRPEYSTNANVITQTDPRELGFYVACAQGWLPQVESYLEECDPTQAVRQYGLERASFANQPDVALCLLKHGTILHDNVFLRSWTDPPKYAGGRGKVVTLFDKGREVSIPLLEVFVEFGWHPNQLWTGFSWMDNNRLVSPIIESLGNRPLLTFLLSHGADPMISHHNVGIGDSKPLNRRASSKVLGYAILTGDPTLVALLVAHGADPAYAMPLHELVKWKGGAGTTAFSVRRPMAEFILSSGMAGVNDIKKVPFLDMTRPARMENLTTFAFACAGQDWEYAEWLLEHGADPNLLNGRAFEPTYFSKPHDGPNDPQAVRDLVDRVRARREGS